MSPQQLVAVVVLACTLASCAGAGGRREGPSLVASFYPLAFAARAIAGERASVVDLTPAGAEPHDLELTPGGVRALVEADVVLLLGGGFQPAVEEAAREATGIVVTALGDRDSAAAEGAAAPDVHVWLDPRRMIGIADRVTTALARVDPQHAEQYRSNETALARRLRRLDSRLAAGLSRCRTRTFVVAHEAFGHLARRYGLHQLAISGADPESEPSPARVARAVTRTRAEGVSTIFLEPLVPSGVAEAVAAETGARTDVLDPLEGAPAAGGYVHAMEKNLEALRRALGCR